MDVFDIFYSLMGLVALSWKEVLMICIGSIFIYIGIRYKMEPLLLIPIGFSAIIVNLPLTGLVDMPRGFLYLVYTYLIRTEAVPLLIFLGIGAMTDFEPLLADPKTFLLGAAAQIGIYCALLSSLILGFNMNQAAAIGIIGGADGPTTIYTATKLAPEILGAVAVAAYSYMSLVPIIQPPVIRFLTTRRERMIKMKPLKTVSKREKILFPIITTIVVGLLVPPAVPLIGMLMFGNLLRECGVTERLSQSAQNEIINIATVFLGLGVGYMMTATRFLNLQTVEILMLGVVAFITATAGGVLFGKIFYLLSRGKINPMIGAAGVSAVPMSARVVQKMGAKEDSNNFLLMHAMGPNIAGVIGSAIAAGIFIAYLL